MAGYPPRQKGPIESSLPAAQFDAAAPAMSPIAAAYAALELINSTRQDRAYVGATAHPGLDANLNGLERAARDIVYGAGQGQLTDKANALAKAIRNTAELATSIAARPGERPTDRAKSRELAEKLLSLLAGWAPAGTPR